MKKKHESVLVFLRHFITVKPKTSQNDWDFNCFPCLVWIKYDWSLQVIALWLSSLCVCMGFLTFAEFELQLELVKARNEKRNGKVSKDFISCRVWAPCQLQEAAQRPAWQLIKSARKENASISSFCWTGERLSDRLVKENQCSRDVSHWLSDKQ